MALELARRGAALVLASRRKPAAEDCRAFGSPALTFALDVTDEDAVHDLAKMTFRRFGRLDIWLSNAVVGLYGDF